MRSVTWKRFHPHTDVPVRSRRMKFNLLITTNELAMFDFVCGSILALCEAGQGCFLNGNFPPRRGSVSCLSGRVKACISSFRLWRQLWCQRLSGLICLGACWGVGFFFFRFGEFINLCGRVEGLIKLFCFWRYFCVQSIIQSLLCVATLERAGSLIL